jgi:hypothetical protein
MQLFHQRQLHD